MPRCGRMEFVVAKSIGDIGDYIVGWREVEVIGYYVEEFLNLIKDERIDLWDVSKEDQCHISFKIHSFSAEKLFELSESKQSLREMEITVGETNGLLEDLLKYKFRSGLFVGVVFFCRNAGYNDFPYLENRNSRLDLVK